MTRQKCRYEYNKFLYRKCETEWVVEKLKINAVRYVFEFIHYNNNPLPPDDASATDANHHHHRQLLKSHMHLTQYINQVCIICGSVKVTLCPLMSSIDGVRTCTTPSTHLSVDLVIVL